MFDMIVAFINVFLSELFRDLTGRNLTEAEIRLISKHTVGRYLAGSLPEVQGIASARERVEEAQGHIETANAILSGMQMELSAQSEQFDRLIAQIEEKKQTAEHYGALARANQEGGSAIREEIEATLQRELTAQSERNKGLRQLASLLIWLFTLIAGAALSSYFTQVVAWIRSFA